jgi:UTP--glucose-1-phosphate uridylyltransferase
MKTVETGIIAAAGGGTRMWPASKGMQKEMFPVGSLPALAHVVLEMVEAGITEISIVVRQGGADAIKALLDPNIPPPKNMRDDESSMRFESAIHAARFRFVEQSGPYGNGTPLMDAANWTSAPCVYAFADDIVIGENLSKGLIQTYSLCGGPVLATQSVPIADVSKFGILECAQKGRMSTVTRLVEKPLPGTTKSRLAVVGRYLITEDVLSVLKKTSPGKNGEIWLSDAFGSLLEAGASVASYRLTKGRWYTVGNVDGYARAVQAAVRASAGAVRSNAPPQPGTNGA